jgi:hypothetical protein
MSPKKRAPKKTKKAVAKKKAAPKKKTVAKKKPVAKKKLAAKKELVAKKKPAAEKKIGRKAGSGAASVAGHHKGDQHSASHTAGALGEWSDESAEEQDRETSLFDDDDIGVDYGGSK